MSYRNPVGQEEFSYYPLKTNEYLLKIDGWKMIRFLLKWSLFRGTFTLRIVAVFVQPAPLMSFTAQFLGRKNRSAKTHFIKETTRPQQMP